MIFFNSLTVKVSTNLLLPAGNTFAVGVDINLQCEITGWPTPVVTWYKDDVELSPSDRIEITGWYQIYHNSQHRLFFLN